MKTKSIDLLISNGTVLTMDASETIIQNGAIAVSGEKITSVGPSVDFQSPNASQHIDAHGGIIMPGLVNTHTHLPMSLFRGLADDLPLSVWLNEYMFVAEKKYLNPKSVQIGTLLSCVEMMLSGTTTCCDGYFFENQVAEAVKKTGMRAVLGHGVIDFPAPGAPDPIQNLQNVEIFMDAWQGQSKLITPSVFCHSPYTCSTETLKTAKAAAANRGLLFQIHAAETRTELDEIKSKQGVSPIMYLDQIGILDEQTLLVHAIWIDANDIERIARRGAKVSHNPESNMKLASGIAPIPDLLASGVTVGLGTDGCASNNNLDLFSEMDVAAKLHKVNRLDSTIMEARSLVKMATIDGAKAIGLGDQIGSIEPGKKADLIILDSLKPHLVPMYNPMSQITYAVCGSDVRDVIIGGKVVIRNHHFLTLDLNELLEKAIRFCTTIKETFEKCSNSF
jgi:5-methylthioadenosine/S-adenosylhomocysteine deaminase